MKQNSFSQDEWMLIGCFHEENKAGTIRLLKDTRRVLKEIQEDESDEEMIQLLSSTIEKLEQLDEETFHLADLQKYLNNLQEDQENV